MSFSACSISSGSSGSSSICACPRIVAKASLRGSEARSRGSRPTSTVSASFAIASLTSRRLSPARTRTSRASYGSNPGDSTWIV
jgi:hypothetical protein